MNQKPSQKRVPPPRTQARVIIGSSQIKRTAANAANPAQNRNFNQATTTTGGVSSTNSQSTNTRQNWNSKKASSNEPIRANSKNARLPPPASMISSNLRAVGKMFFLNACISKMLKQNIVAGDARFKARR